MIWRLVLDALEKDEDVGTIPEIAAAAGLTRAEAEVAVAGLEKRGLLRLVRPLPTTTMPHRESYWVIAR